MAKRKRRKRPCEICGRTHTKLSSRQCIKKVLWEALRDAMDARDGCVCQKCGSMAGTQMSHVYRRSQDGRLAYDLMNVKTLCGQCHLGWWHNNEAEGGVWFASRWPERWAYLTVKIKEHRETPGTIPMSWYQNQLETLREET